MRAVPVVIYGVAVYFLIGATVTHGWSWWPAVLCVVIPGAVWLYLAVAPHEAYLTRRNRAAKGLCVHCGYDLRADLTGVCPECGGLAR